VYARSTTLNADPSMMHAGIAFVRDEVWPTVRAAEGCLGLSMLADRESGRAIVTSSWATQEALASTRQMVMPLRDKGVQITGSEAPTVEEWEVAAMHRAHNTGVGSCVRVAWSRVPKDHIDRAIEFYKQGIRPQAEQMQGFASASLMVDRAAARGVTSVAYDSLASLEATREQADYMRERSTQEANVEFLDVAEFELVIAHLHLPELV
jgi:hypothetical protein